MHLNIEIKARCADPGRIRTLLQELAADFKGEDRQIDTYFNVPEGRLKLREGNIENALIHYRRTDQAGPKRSEVTLYRTTPGAALKEVLTTALGVRTVVDKKREIYFIGNVKFHIDSVKGLGSFVEIEAIDVDGSLGEVKLREQCDYYLDLFDIREENLVEESYSDMVF